MLVGDTLTRDGALAFLFRQTPHLHVGSKTALEWRGIRHQMPFREVIELWSDARKPLPPWFTTRFPARLQTTQLFDDRLKPGTGLQPLPNGHPEVLVSVPERALLELLSDIGKYHSLQEARDLVELMPALRQRVLDELLQHSVRIKVVRSAALLAAELKLPWADLAKKHSDRIGGGSRWIAVTRSGERLDMKRP